MNEPLRIRYEASWLRGDGREITGVVAPYDTVATIPGMDGSPIRVKLSAGLFRKQMKAADRVELRYEHAADGDLMGKIGRGVRLSETPVALEGTFRVLDTTVGEQALALIDEGMARGLSVGFYQRAAHTDGDGTLVVTTGHLVEVSLCREPAFAGANVLRVASMMASPPRDESLRDRLRAAGY